MSKVTLSKQDSKKLLDIILDLMERPESEAFREPVDFESLGLSDYPKIVKKPMDLSTIKENLEMFYYKSVK